MGASEWTGAFNMVQSRLSLDLSLQENGALPSAPHGSATAATVYVLFYSFVELR